MVFLFGKPWDEKNIMLVGIVVSISTQNAQALSALTGSIRNAKKELGDLGKAAVAGGAALAGLAIAGSVRAAVMFESAMADVNKVLGTAEVQAVGLDSALIKMTRTIPNSATGLAAIAAAGGQLGIKAKDIGQFTELVAKMGIAFDVTPDQAGTAFAKLQNVFSLSIKDLGVVGDAVNELSNNSASSAADVVESMTRIGGVGRTFGLTAQQTAALSSAIISLGNAPEIAATSIASILPALQGATSQTAKFKSGLALLGISAQEMEQQVAGSPTEALQMFIGKLGELDKISRVKVISKMFGQGADSRALATLANDATQLTKAFDLVANQGNYAGSMVKEFEARSATTANATQLFKNALFEVGLVVGEKLLPPIGMALAFATPLLQATADFVRVLPSGVVAIASLGIVTGGAIAAFAVFNPALASVAFNFLRVAATSPAAAIVSLGTALRTGAVSAIAFSRATVTMVGSGFAAIPGMVAATAASIGRFSAMIGGQFLGAIGAAIAGLKGLTLASLWGGIVSGAGAAIGAIQGVVAATVSGGAALLANPLVLGIGAIAVAALLIYKYWQPISAFFAGVVAGIGQALAPLQPQINAIAIAFTPLIQAVQVAASWFMQLIAPVNDSNNAARSLGVTVGQFLGGMINNTVKGIVFLVSQITRLIGVANTARSSLASVPGMGWVAPTLPTPSTDSSSTTIPTPNAASASTVIPAMSQGHIPVKNAQLGLIPYSPLIQAARKESRGMPGGARLVVANDREFILKDKGQATATAPAQSPVSSSANGGNNISIVLNVLPGEGATAIAKQVIDIIEKRYQEERRSYLGT